MVGFIIYFSFFIYLIKKFTMKLPKDLKYCVYMMLLGQFVVFCGGS